MFEAVGHAVSRLIRIRYGSVMLPKGLRRGVWLELDHRDVARLTEAAGMVLDTAEVARTAQPTRNARSSPSRRQGQGPRPSAPRLVDGPNMPRTPGSKRRGDHRDDRPARGDDDARPVGRGARQPDPMKTSFGYIGDQARTGRGNNPNYTGPRSGKPRGRKA